MLLLKEKKRKEGGEGHLYIIRECQAFHSCQEPFVNEMDAEHFQEDRGCEGYLDLHANFTCHETFTAQCLHSR